MDLQKIFKLVSRYENVLICSHWTKVNFIIAFKNIKCFIYNEITNLDVV